MRRPLLALAALLAMSACADLNAMQGGSDTLPAMRWDHRPEAELWTAATLEALDASALPDFVPADITTYCPGYASASEEDRAAFWAGLLSALAKHESTWNPKAAGGGGKWIGLVQIAPGTASGYGCDVRTVKGLKDGAENLSCAVKIMSRTVVRDGVISAGSRGVAADWGPFHSKRKRADMQAWTSAQPYCASA